MYLVIFDKTGDTSLSGWHYERLREFDAEWIQRSAVKLDNSKAAMEFAEKLQEFGVDHVKILKAYEITNKS